MLKKVLLGILWICGIIGWYGLVFSMNFIFTPETKLVVTLSPNIYLWDDVLSSTILGYKSNTDISSAVIHSSCDTETQFLEEFEGVSYFSLKYLGNNCKNANIILKVEGERILNTASELKIVTKSELFSLMVDNPTKNLQKLNKSLQKNLKKYHLYEKLHTEKYGKYIKYRKRQRKFHESQYQFNLVQEILLGRGTKYVSPVSGKGFSRQFSRLPNAGRPYRETYTDGIHHGWDVPAKLGEEVVAIDQGIVVRIVDGFSYGDLSRIHYGTLSNDEKLKNLDILRGNQVWLKTTKGEVIFYSHLTDVSQHIAEWDIVSKGTVLGTVGITGIPAKGYDDYHLHFALHVNPYISKKAGTYDFSDYMQWDWKFKWEGFEYILENQKEIFDL